MESISLPPEAVTAFARDGHTVVRGLATAAELGPYREAVGARVTRYQARLPALAERDTYGKAFVQAPNLWRRDPVIADFVFSPRFAKAAADLLGVEGVRLYHDQALAKEAGGGHTPWHQDQVYWPLDTDDTVTMWMPLVNVPVSAGPMTFASGSHRLRDLGPLVIGDESDEAFGRLVSSEGLHETSHGPLRAGDATFHRGWTLHRAGANHTDDLRLVMTVIYFADGTRVGTVDRPSRQLDHAVWLDSIPPGEPAAGSLNPVLWPPTTPREPAPDSAADTAISGAVSASSGGDADV